MRVSRARVCLSSAFAWSGVHVDKTHLMKEMEGISWRVLNLAQEQASRSLQCQDMRIGEKVGALLQSALINWSGQWLQPKLNGKKVEAKATEDLLSIPRN